MSYLEKPIHQLSKTELDDLKQKLITGNILCPICRQWCQRLFKIPARCRDFVYSSFKPLCPATLANGMPHPFFNPAIEACEYCIALGADRKRKKMLYDHLIKSGHIPGSKTKEKPGSVYIVRHKNYFKIGATTQSIKTRITQAGYKVIDFFHGIETKSPFGLESHLHVIFKSKHIRVRSHAEIFNLVQSDLDYIRSIKTIYGDDIVHRTKI